MILPSRSADGVGARLGLRDLVELSGGHQSRVFRADSDRGPVIVKLVEALGVDRSTLAERLTMVTTLGRRTEAVCAPVAIHGEVLHHLDTDGGVRWYAVCYQFAAGERPDPDDPGDAALMGRALADLHRHLAALPPFRLPVVTAFRRAAEGSPRRGVGPRQLLHGDFTSANIRVTAGRPRVVDFDDCGYGPVEFDLAQALYVELFDSVTRPAPGRYEAFRTAFLAGYGGRAGVGSEAVLDLLITERVHTLGRWLDDPAQAPPGIRNSSAAWLATLRRFVGGHSPDQV